MSENIIYCFSGSGNSLELAKRIGKALGDTDIVMMRKAPAITDATAYRRVGFIFPCYGGGLPGKVEEYVSSVRVGEHAYRFGIVEYAGYMGCGLRRIHKIIGLDYWNGLSQCCSCIWLMPRWMGIPPMSIHRSQQDLEKKAAIFAEDIRLMRHSKKRPPRNALCELESRGFLKINKKIRSVLHADEKCVSCGTCEKLCPRENIRLENGKPKIGTDCIGCLSCVQYCPTEAFQVGKLTRRRKRFRNANVTADELSQAVIHID